MVNKWRGGNAAALYAIFAIFVFAGLVLSPLFIFKSNQGNQGVINVKEKISLGTEELSFPVVVSVITLPTTKVITMIPVNLKLAVTFGLQGSLSSYAVITHATVSVDNALFASGADKGDPAGISLNLVRTSQGNWNGSASANVEYTSAGPWSGTVTFSARPTKGGAVMTWSIPVVIQGYHIWWSSDLQNFLDSWGLSLLAWGVGCAVLGYGVYAIGRSSRKHEGRHR